MEGRLGTTMWLCPIWLFSFNSLIFKIHQTYFLSLTLFSNLTFGLIYQVLFSLWRIKPVLQICKVLKMLTRIVESILKLGLPDIYLVANGCLGLSLNYFSRQKK